MQLVLYNLKHNIRLAYRNSLSFVIVITAFDIAFAPSSPMELAWRL